jgi:hypothetical protein
MMQNNNTNINFSDLDKLTLKKILAQSKRGKVNSRTFYKAFPLVENDYNEINQFDTAKEVSDFLEIQGIVEADGESNKLILLNGWHFFNRLFYVVSTKSWSCGDKELDGELYIEVNY